MSNDKLKQLGIPRRSFLTKAAAATFVAPVVVSFGLDNVAEASPHIVVANQPVQCFTNQPGQYIANQFRSGADEILFDMLRLILSSVQGEFGAIVVAEELGGTLLRVMLEAAAGDKLACQSLATFQNQVEGRSGQLPDNVASELLCDAEKVASCLGCICSVGGED